VSYVFSARLEKHLPKEKFFEYCMGFLDLGQLDDVLFSPSANLPTGLYILFALITSFFIFFLMITQRTIISGSTGPIFAIFSRNESVLSGDDRSGPLFPISQGTLQPTSLH